MYKYTIASQFKCMYTIAANYQSTKIYSVIGRILPRV